MMVMMVYASKRYTYSVSLKKYINYAYDYIIFFNLYLFKSQGWA